MSADELGLTRQVDEATIAHLERSYADRIGPDRALATRMHALNCAVVSERERYVGTEDESAARDERIVGRALLFEEYLRGDVEGDLAAIDLHRK